MHQKGTLHLIPCPIDPTGHWKFNSESLSVITTVRIIVCERIRTTRRMIRQYFSQDEFDEIEFFELDKHRAGNTESRVLDQLKKGHDVIFMSEAGMPCIADPGHRIVLMTHQHGVSVKPYVGPSSFLMALMASGLNGQSFSFHGYLPRQPQELQQTLKRLEQQVHQTGASQLFMETPYRNQKLFDHVLRILSGGLLLNISMDITGSMEMIKTASIQDWNRHPITFDEKYPAVFIIGKNAF